ncbi:MAG: Ig-like domain repeat protein, partial [Spirochaetales bacterium]|nr:Ig-like domain repeat protein [Candidatus Physcosoma equi]
IVTFDITDEGGVRFAKVYLNDELKATYGTEDCGYDDSYKTRHAEINLNVPYLTAGEYQLKVEVTDFAGYTSTEVRSLSIENKAPQIKAISIDRGEILVTQQDGSLSFNVSDEGGVRSIEVYLDEELVQKIDNYSMYGDIENQKPFISASVNNNCTVDLRVPYRSNGDYTVKIVATDLAGNKSEVTRIVKVSKELPAIAELNISEGQSYSELKYERVSFKVSSSAGLREVYAMMGERRIEFNDWWMNESESATKTAYCDMWIPEFPNGDYAFTVHSVNYAGEETTLTRNITIQKDLPSVTMNVVEKKASMTIRAIVSDTSCINEMKLYVGDVEIGSVSRPDGNRLNWSYEVDFRKSQFENGNYEVYALIITPANEELKSVYGTIDIDNSKIYGDDAIDSLWQVSGLLSDEMLHWTKDMSPVVVTGNITIPNGRQLVIDPGVEVLFDGKYSINGRGTLYAVGTENESITFCSTRGRIENHDGYYGNWGGLNLSDTLNVSRDGYIFSYQSGNIINAAEIYDTDLGVSGTCYVENSTLVSSNFAIGGNDCFRGYLVNNKIDGRVCIYLDEAGFVFGNAFDGSSVENMNDNTKTFDTRWSTRYIINNKFMNHHLWFEYYIRDVKYNTFEDCYLDWYSMDCDKTGFAYNEFIRLKNTIELGNSVEGMTFTNFIDSEVSTILNVKTSWNASRSYHDFTNVYWGEEHTAELMSLKAQKNANASFIYDGYDNQDYAVVDWSDFALEPIANIGYQGRDFVDVAVETNGGEKKIGSDIELRIRQMTNTEAEKYR